MKHLTKELLMESKGIKRVYILCSTEKKHDDSGKALMFAKSFLPDLYGLKWWGIRSLADGIPDNIEADELLIIMRDYSAMPYRLLDVIAGGTVVIIGDGYETLTAYEWGKEPETVGIQPGMKRTFKGLKLTPILE